MGQKAFLHLPQITRRIVTKDGRRTVKRLVSLLMVCCIITIMIQIQAEADGKLSVPYILEPPTVPEEPKTEHEFMSILFLAADNGEGMSGGAKKADIRNCHTDSVMLIALDLTDSKISLISFPRDTLTYVPGVTGIYRINAAFNCSSSIQEGLERTCDTVSYLMGGIRPDHYVLVTPDLVVKVGDAIGGLDIDVKTGFYVTEGVEYKKGMQHLDGSGIRDYARTRRRANSNNNDIGRTERQRQIVTALFEKIKGNFNYAYDILDVIVDCFDSEIYSDLSVADMLGMLPLIDGFDYDSISNYVMDGELERSMLHFNLNFIDQKKRQQTIKGIYGIEVPRLLLNSRGYANYLYKFGFDIVKTIHVCNEVVEWAAKHGYNGERLDTAKKLCDETIIAFSAIDDKREKSATNKADKKKEALRDAVLKLAKDCGYTGEIVFDAMDWFNEDPYINEYYQFDWS